MGLTNLPIAVAMLCDDADASQAAYARLGRLSVASPTVNVVTDGVTVMSVPVLSSRIARMAASCSSDSPLRNNTCDWAARPSAVQRAIGVASPRAHGHAISR